MIQKTYNDDELFGFHILEPKDIYIYNDEMVCGPFVSAVHAYQAMEMGNLINIMRDFTLYAEDTIRDIYGDWEFEDMLDGCNYRMIDQELAEVNILELGNEIIQDPIDWLVNEIYDNTFLESL